MHDKIELHQMNEIDKMNKLAKLKNYSRDQLHKLLKKDHNTYRKQKLKYTVSYYDCNKENYVAFASFNNIKSIVVFISARLTFGCTFGAFHVSCLLFAGGGKNECCLTHHAHSIL
jgi:hypothetical protein